MRGYSVRVEELEFYSRHGRWTPEGNPTKIELVLDLLMARQRIKELERSLEMHGKLREMRFKEPE